MKNEFGFECRFAEDDTVFHEAREEVFDLYGLYRPRELPEYRRLPDDVAEATSANVHALARNTAGGRVRFATDSPYIIIRAEMSQKADMDHFSRTGSAAFDTYVKVGARYVYHDTFRPCLGTFEGGYEGRTNFPTQRRREVMLHFPTYSNVEKLYIGIKAGSTLEHGEKYAYEKPVVYYGSSITQGACASRPGNAYESIIANDYSCDFINLGFSGSALAEDAIVDYINSLDMSIFVMDYDHNASVSLHLEMTHEPFFKKIRASHPDLPIILISRPTFEEGYGGPNAYGVSEFPADNDILRCRAVVFRTYMNALDAGDNNVAFIDGASLFNGPHADLCTVDGTHPNDAGFLRMADRIGEVVAKYLK